MRYYKKLIYVLCVLVTVICLGLLCGCGNSGRQGNGPAEQISVGGNRTDTQLSEDAGETSGQAEAGTANDGQGKADGAGGQTEAGIANDGQGKAGEAGGQTKDGRLSDQVEGSEESDQAEDSQNDPVQKENPVAEKLLAITVDDGPDGEGCKAYLEICRENDIVLTFFVIGQNIEAHSGQLREMLDAGCEIGNHSWSHGYLNSMTADELQREIGDTNEMIRRSVPEAEISLARAPYFAYSDLVYESVGYPLIDAALAESDADQEAKTLQTLLSAEDGDIVLLHCWNQGSIRALREAVPKLKEKGFRFVTVSGLLEAKGVDPKAGTVYRHVAENLMGLYQKTEQLFSDGKLTSGDWNNWTDAAVLDAARLKKMQAGQGLWVEYDSASAPCLILQSWSGGAGWVQMTPTSDDGRTAIFTYEDMLEQFGAEDLKRLDACVIRPVGANLTVLSVDVATRGF